MNAISSPRRAGAALTVLVLVGAGCSKSPEDANPAGGEGAAQEADEAGEIEVLRPLGSPEAPPVDDAKVRALEAEAAAMALEPKPIHEPDGSVSSYLLLPKSWRVRDAGSGQYTIAGPGGVEVGETERAEFVWTTDPMGQQTAQRMGKQVAPVASLEDILRESVADEARAKGYSFVRSYPLPEEERFWDAFGAAMPDTGSRRTYHALASEWKNAAGDGMLVILFQPVVEQNGFLTWSISATPLSAPAATFERAKRIYLDARAHRQVDEGWRQRMGVNLTAQLRRNDEENRRWTAQSAAQHKQRMADIAAWGRAALARGRTNSEILDMNHEAFMARSAMNDAGHARTIDGITERTVVRNPETGRRFKVDTGYKHYWGDGQGGYIGTNDPNYDPRLDPLRRETPWVRFDTPEGT
ncbi:MAG: hypothetical protein H6745_00785 [Deltaproteobacteria bacterium]|nr:hypothetical protein [Deltaproteobacteria bacterium]